MRTLTHCYHYFSSPFPVWVVLMNDYPPCFYYLQATSTCPFLGGPISKVCFAWIQQNSLAVSRFVQKSIQATGKRAAWFACTQCTIYPTQPISLSTASSSYASWWLTRVSSGRILDLHLSERRLAFFLVPHQRFNPLYCLGFDYCECNTYCNYSKLSLWENSKLQGPCCFCLESRG